MTDERIPTRERDSTGSRIDEETDTSKSGPGRRLLFGILAVAMVGLVALVAFWPREKPRVVAGETPPTLEGRGEGANHAEEHSQEGSIELDDETAELMGVETARAEEAEIEETIATTGRVLVAPGSQAVVGAKVSGRIVSLTVEPGQAVRAGQTLVVVDSPEIADLRGQLAEARVRLQIAEAAVARVAKAESRAAVIQAKSRLDLAEATVNRKRRLVEIGAAARTELESAEAEFRNAKAEYDFQSNIQVAREQSEARGEAEATRATVSRLADQLSALGAAPNAKGGQIPITSSVSGTVIDVHVTVGEAVTPDKELLTVMNLSKVIVEAQLPESQAARVVRGRKLVARVAGIPDGVFEGKVDSIGQMVDPSKRTVPVRARVTNSRALLKHEMGVEVQISAGASKRATTVPVSALVDEEGQKVIYVKEGERYERRVVTVGSISYSQAEILSGVDAGEEVVVRGAYQLANARKGGGEEGEAHDDH